MTAAERIGEALKKIWNGRMAGEVYTLYLYNAELILGVNRRIYGRENILSRIIEMHSMLPDLFFTIEESFGGKNSSGEETLYLRWTLEGTHLGPGIYGDASGCLLKLKGMSFITLREGLIAEQRDVMNDGNLPEQLGLDEEEINQLLEQLAPEKPLFDPLSFGESGRIIGQNPPYMKEGAYDISDVPNSAENPCFFEALLKTVWNQRSPGIIAQSHDTDAFFILPGSDEFLGSRDYTEFVFSLIAVFPDLSVYLDEVITPLSSKSEGKTAVRCTLQGCHRKSGRYGEATGRQVTIPAIIEYQFEKEKIKSETLYMSEFELMVHLYSYRRSETFTAENAGEEKTEE